MSHHIRLQLELASDIDLTPPGPSEERTDPFDELELVNRGDYESEEHSQHTLQTSDSSILPNASNCHAVDAL